MDLSLSASSDLQLIALNCTDNLEVDQWLNELALSDSYHHHHYHQSPSICNANLDAPLDPLMRDFSDHQQQRHQHNHDVWPEFQKDSDLHVCDSFIELDDIPSPTSALTGAHANAFVAGSTLSTSDDDSGHGLLPFQLQLVNAATYGSNEHVSGEDTSLATSPPHYFPISALLLERHEPVWDGSNLVAGPVPVQASLLISASCSFGIMRLITVQKKRNSRKKKRPDSMRMHEQKEEDREDEAPVMEPRKKVKLHTVDSCASPDKHEQEKNTKVAKQRMLGKDGLSKPTILAKPVHGLKTDNQTIASASRWAEHLLGACMSAIAQNNITRTQHLMWVLNDLSSFNGNANQRLAAYGLKALFSRVTGCVSLPPTYSCYMDPPRLRQAVPFCRHLQSAHLRFLEVTPWHQAIYTIANGGLVEACEAHMCVHVIDIGVSHGTQWPVFIEALATRPSGCPKLIRLTVVQSSMSTFFKKEHSESSPYGFWGRLEPFAKNLGVKLELRVITRDLMRLTKEELDVRSGEAVLVSAQFRLHQLSNEAIGGETGSKENEMSPRDKFLGFLHGLQPEVLVLSENDSEQSAQDFQERCTQAMEFYWRFLDSMQVSMEGTKRWMARAESQGSDQDEEQEEEQEEGENDGNSGGRGLMGSADGDRGQLDETTRQMMEGEAGIALVNCVACEGEARVERNEGHEGWCKRLSEAGFVPAWSSPGVMENARSLLRKHNASCAAHADSACGSMGPWELSVEPPCSILRWKALPTTFTSLWKVAAS